eukprot:SAG11_NODE_7963_length_1077_cov_1.295501_1_plen_249_part_01
MSTTNVLQDGDESGVDCGGTICERRCELGDVCMYNTDCVTGLCDQGGVSARRQMAADGPAQMTASQCAEECRSLGFCCNDYTVGSNRLLSCAQACMIRARGATAEQCTGHCDEVEAGRNNADSCSRTIGGHAYSFCQSCTDLDDTCPHGVQSGLACAAGCSVPEAAAAVSAAADVSIDANLDAMVFSGGMLDGISFPADTTGTLYVMFSIEDVHERFGSSIHALAAKHFVAVSVNSANTLFSYINSGGT